MLQLCTLQKVAEVFYREPTTHHYLKGISRQVGIAHTSVKKNLETLEKEKIVIKTIEKRNTRSFPHYTANIDNKNYMKYKKLYNLQALTHSGLIEFISDTCYPHCIVLFGSYARGEDTERSDIDIFVEAKEKKVDVKKYEKILGRKIELHIRKSFGNISTELKNSIVNGIVLQGYLNARQSDIITNDGKNRTSTSTRDRFL